MAGVEDPEDYFNILSRAGKKSEAYTVEERKKILEFQRVNRIFSPDVTMMHGATLLQSPSSLEDDTWAMYFILFRRHDLSSIFFVV